MNTSAEIEAFMDWLIAERHRLLEELYVVESERDELLWELGDYDG